ncbi:hypothetical protein VNO78_12297 [Psophocarpus tetragonolobus]|uniref:Uncharacterized protein n=1 Tax=Psophocarpus tetragonolobus TaxID=3891 RepID=A0AAN9XNV3_PSOTE
MHDLVYDLARFVSGKSSAYFESGEIQGTLRHVAFLPKMFDISKRFESLYELNCLRTFLPLNFFSTNYLSKRVSHDWLPKLRHLRTLSLFAYENITKLPESICNLVLLRYLDLSRTSIERLSNETFKLYNLQTLKLSRCRYLTELPESICSLMLLRYVDLSNTSIERLPKETFRLYNLETLKLSNCKSLVELPEQMGNMLPSLKELVIERMNMMKTVGDEFYCNNGGSHSSQPFPLLESIQFEDMLEWEEWLPFEIEGNKFPFSCLKRLSLSNCPKLRGNMPNHLPSLTKVKISKCNQLQAKSSDLHWNTSIESVHIDEGGEGSLSFLDSFSCTCLSIRNYDNLSSLPRTILGLNCLQKLELDSIPTLISFPADGLPVSLKSLRITDCEELEFFSPQSCRKYTSLAMLSISRSCHSLSSFPLDCFPSLEWLHINDCDNIEAITTQGGTTSLKLVSLHVYDCEKLESFPEYVDLPALQRLYLLGLPKLASLSPRYLPSSLESLDLNVGMLSCMPKHELRFLFQRLTSLSCLTINGFGNGDVFNTLLKESLLPTSLLSLEISMCDGLTCLCLEGKWLQHLSSLTQLRIENCERLESLPEDQLPSSLEVLKIYKCPLLEARYEDQKGRHWSKIAHIPVIFMKRVIIA